MIDMPNSELLDAPLSDSRPHITKPKLEQFQRLGIITPRDLLYHLPRDYEDRRHIDDIADAADGERQTFEGIVSRVSNRHNGRQYRQSAKLYAIRDDQPDESEFLNLSWFGQRHLANTIRSGDRLVVHGVVHKPGRRGAINQPEHDIISPPGSTSHQTVNTAGIIPVYPLTAGMNQEYMRRAILETLHHFQPALHRNRPDTKPYELHRMLRSIHRPERFRDADDALNELTADELLEIQLALLELRHQREVSTITPGLAIDPAARDALLAGLPFRPTAAQLRCMDEIRHDLAQTGPAMNRLLQGEVGSGKTLVALAAAVDTASDGGQIALLAPTSLLAEQHFRTITELLNAQPSPTTGASTYQVRLPGLRRPFTIALLTAQTPARARRSILGAAQLGTITMLAGTHSIISDQVELPHLKLAIADEQHRFGVAQRAALRHDAHYLMLTATPIPRTMQLTLYRDLDISTFDAMPISKQPVQTTVLAEHQRSQAYDAIRAAVAAGQQAFVIYPLIDPSPDVEGLAGTDRYPDLCREFDAHTVRMIHGRMKPGDRDKELLAFRNGETDILVSTPIVEVGIDIPNATVMLIESSERFGLAQLHQLRGRIGRGEIPGVCYIMITPGITPSRITRSRIRAIRDSNDGIKLAEADLYNRGHGDIAGTRQSGQGTLLRPGLTYDLPLLEQEREAAERIHAADPHLQRAEHRSLQAARRRLLARMTAAPTDH